MEYSYLENLSVLITVVYPAFWSLKAQDLKECKHWLKYWVIYSLYINMIEIYGYALEYHLIT